MTEQRQEPESVTNFLVPTPERVREIRKVLAGYLESDVAVPTGTETAEVGIELLALLDSLAERAGNVDNLRLAREWEGPARKLIAALAAYRAGGNWGKDVSMLTPIEVQDYRELRHTATRLPPHEWEPLVDLIDSLAGRASAELADGRPRSGAESVVETLARYREVKT